MLFLNPCANHYLPFIAIPSFLRQPTMYSVFPSTQPAISNTSPSKRLFLLDVDGTLIVSKSGRKWAESASDWIWAHPAFPAFLAEKAQTTVVALVTNQSMWLQARSAAPAKIASILAALEAAVGWRPWCLVATATTKQRDTVYRKPARGLYDVLLKELGWRQEDVGCIEMCGDAVGAEDPCPAYRWASSDRDFAVGIGATFVRPCDLGLPTLAPPLPLASSGQKELIICVGNPGSGKSTLARSFAAVGYVHVEQDVTKTAAATLKAVKAAAAVMGCTGVVVDATHSSVKNRAPYIALAKSCGFAVRIVWCMRDGRHWNALRPKPVPEIAYAVYSKYFEEPTVAEGEGAILEIVYP